MAALLAPRWPSWLLQAAPRRLLGHLRVEGHSIPAEGISETNTFLSIMGKSAKGGVYGFLRGKVGTVSYAIQSAKNSKSGKKEQIVRILPDSVANPNTVAQIMQRMKAAPAHKFYAALSTILSNSFQGVSYGEQSRRHFLQLAMKADGPYIPKGVDRFIPAEYQISEGELPEVKCLRIAPDNQEITNTLLHLDYTITGETQITTAQLAEVLGVAEDTQITVITVTNENGIFTPHFAGWDERITIAELPAAAIVRSAFSLGGNVAINLSAVDATLGDANIVAAAVILSRQDASGVWLRSPQNMVLTVQMYEQLYGVDALNTAIRSYQDSGLQNSVGSQWYLNLGLNQFFRGRVYAYQPMVAAGSPWDGVKVVMCLTATKSGDLYQMHDGAFCTSVAADGLVMILEDGRVTTREGLTVAAFAQVMRWTIYDYQYCFHEWNDNYAAQAGF